MATKRKPARKASRPARRILGKQPKTVILPAVLARRPSLRRKILPGRDVTTRLAYFYTEPGQAPQRFEEDVTVRVGAGNFLLDVRDLKKKLKTWKAVAARLGVGDRYLRKLRTGSERKKPGTKIVAAVARMQGELKLKPHGKRPADEWERLMWTRIRQIVKRLGSDILIGHSIEWVAQQ